PVLAPASESAPLTLDMQRQGVIQALLEQVGNGEPTPDVIAPLVQWVSERGAMLMERDEQTVESLRLRTARALGDASPAWREAYAAEVAKQAGSVAAPAGPDEVHEALAALSRHAIAPAALGEAYARIGETAL